MFAEQFKTKQPLAEAKIDQVLKDIKEILQKASPLEAVVFGSIRG